MSRDTAWGAFFFGALTGAAVGLLTAPRPGRELREYFKNAAEDLGESMEEIPGKLKDAGRRMMRSGREAYQQTRQEFGSGSRSSSASSHSGPTGSKSTRSSDAS